MKLAVSLMVLAFPAAAADECGPKELVDAAMWASGHILAVADVSNGGLVQVFVHTLTGTQRVTFSLNGMSCVVTTIAAGRDG